VVREGVYAPFANSTAELVTSRQFLMHLSTPDVVHHLKEVARILKPGGTYICSILNPEYEQRKQREVQLEKSPLIAHQAYDFSHGTTGNFASIIPQYWRSLEDYQTTFACHFAEVTCIPCVPITDRFKEKKPRFYQLDCPMAFVFVLTKKS
jgi:ubiquinone/menaquinone biosynthesis C-methylase UbiE